MYFLLHHLDTTNLPFVWHWLSGDARLFVPNVWNVISPREEEEHEESGRSKLFSVTRKKSPNVNKSCQKMIDFNTFTKIA